MPTSPADETSTRLMGCPRCQAPMQALALPSHKGTPVTVEHCPGCRLVWFDRFESVHLEALGWARLLRVMEASAKQPLADALVEHPACPICAGRLRPVQNRTRFGLFAVLECRHGHGHLHSHSGLLSERGLVRPPGLAERRALAQEKLALHCLNCGAAAAAADDQCRYCRTPLLVLDLPRLAHSLRPRAELMAASPQGLGRHLNWPCRGCGAPLDPGREIHCSRCGHMVVAHDLPDIDPLLDAAEAELADLAAAEARRLARYPSTHRRPAPRVEPVATVAPARRDDGRLVALAADAGAVGRADRQCVRRPARPPAARGAPRGADVGHRPLAGLCRHHAGGVRGLLRPGALAR
ncbi:zf-TFIIB domain-containing protein [Ideonella sp.]|uniref:TFIIB-type zinc ribbon-containing protein n=1 Tax=Ideonella sp. TaxID=1929293 RepID=UPI0035B43C6B